LHMSYDPEVSRLWRVKRTVLELCRDRGYDISADEIEMRLEEFAQRNASGGTVDRDRLNFYAQKEDPNDKIYVFFSEESNVGIKTMRRFITILDEKQVQVGIIIWSQVMTSAARKLISGISADYSIEDFQEADLLVNITHHQLVPPHQIISRQEKAELLKKYRLKETQLPRIMISDPVAKYYGLKRGQVVKITRPSETAGRYVSYRIATS